MSPPPLRPSPARAALPEPAGPLPLPRPCLPLPPPAPLAFLGSFHSLFPRENGDRDKESLGEDTASPALYRQQSSRCCSSTPCTRCWQVPQVLRGDRRDEPKAEAGEEQQGSLFLHMPARSQHLGRSREQQGRAAACEGFGGREETESSLCWECVRA